MRQVFAFAIILAVSVVIFVQLNRGAMYAGPSAVEVSDDLRDCNQQTDHCIMVDKSCGRCCDYDTVNAVYEKVFSENYDDTCKHFRGKTCNCSEVTSYPKCQQSTCELVPIPKL